MKEIKTEVLASPVTLQTQLTRNFLSKSPNNYPTQMAQSLSAQTLWATRDTGISLFTDFHRRAQRNTLRKEESSWVKPYVPVYIVVGAAVWAVVPSVVVISSCRLPADLAFDVKYQPAGLAPSQVVGWTQTMNQPKRGENRVNTAVSPMRGWRLEGRGGGGEERACWEVYRGNAIWFRTICLFALFPSLPLFGWVFIPHSSFMLPGSSLVAMVGIGENVALLCHNLRYWPSNTIGEVL